MFSLAPEIQQELSNLQRRVSAALVSHVPETDALFADETRMNLWLHTMSLGRWLTINSEFLNHLFLRPILNHLSRHDASLWTKAMLLG
jgi:hypothetical protein